MKLGRLSNNTYTCSYLAVPACEECPQSYKSLPLEAEKVLPNGESVQGWTNCQGDSPNPSNIYLDVWLLYEANWWCVKNKAKYSSSSSSLYSLFNSSSSSSSSSKSSNTNDPDNSCECIYYSDYDANIHEKCSGPFFSKSECESRMCQSDGLAFINFDQAPISDQFNNLTFNSKSVKIIEGKGYFGGLFSYLESQEKVVFSGDFSISFSIKPTSFSASKILDIGEYQLFFEVLPEEGKRAARLNLVNKRGIKLASSQNTIFENDSRDVFISRISDTINIHLSDNEAIKLLLNMNGPEFIDSSPNEIAVTANGAQISTAQSKFGGASGYFSGSATITGPDLGLGSESFTLELWFKAENGGGPQYATLFANYESTGYSSGFGLYFNNNGAGAGGISLYAFQFIAQSAQTYNDGLWHHVAVTRVGDTCNLFVDGALVGTGTTLPNRSFSTTTGFMIGGSPEISGRLFNGWIDNVRVIKGVAIYTGEFTPPDANFSVPPPVPKLLLHFDGTNGSTTFKDSSAEPKTPTLNGWPTISSNQKRFGGTSLKTNSGSLLYANDGSFDFESNFTIEGWFYFNQNTIGYQPLITAYSGGDATGFALVLETNNRLHFYGSNGYGYWTLAIGSSYQPPTGTWLHIAVSRTASITRMFVDGVLVSSTNNSSVISGGTTLAIGSYQYFPDFPRTFNGFIDEVRILNGRSAYSENFDRPISPFYFSLSSSSSSNQIKSSSKVTTNAFQSEIKIGGFRGYVDDFLIKKGFVLLPYESKSSEIYCILASDYDSSKQVICGGPYYSGDQCGCCLGCPPPSSSSSSSSLAGSTCFIETTYLPDGSAVVECREQPASSTTSNPENPSSSSQFASSSSSSSQFDSSSSSKCEDMTRHCLYSDFSLGNYLFSLEDKPPPCEEKIYCTVDGCKSLCPEDADGTLVFSCPSFCCGPGVCLYSCNSSAAMDTCFGCSGMWFLNGVGIDEYIEANCKLDCFECDQQEFPGECKSISLYEKWVYPKSWEFIDQLIPTCEDEGFYEDEESCELECCKKTYECDSTEACVLFCDGSGSYNEVDCGTTCVPRWTECDPTTGSTYVGYSDNTSLPVEKVIDCVKRSSCEFYGCQDIGFSTNTSIPDAQSCPQICKENWFCQTGYGCDGPYYSIQLFGFASRSQCEEQCVNRYECYGWNQYGYEPCANTGPSLSGEKDCSKCQLIGYNCNGPAGCIPVYGDPSFATAEYPDISECSQECVMRYKCNQSTGCEETGYAQTGPKSCSGQICCDPNIEQCCKEIDCVPNCDLNFEQCCGGKCIPNTEKCEVCCEFECEPRYICDQSVGCKINGYGPFATGSKSCGDFDCEPRYACDENIGCKLTGYGPNATGSKECSAESCVKYFICVEGVGCKEKYAENPPPGSYATLEECKTVACPVPGCTNPYSPSYNPNATCDDGSCVTCCSSGNCVVNDQDQGAGCNPIGPPLQQGHFGSGCCDLWCSTNAFDCSATFSNSFTAKACDGSTITYDSCFDCAGWSREEGQAQAQSVSSLNYTCTYSDNCGSKSSQCFDTQEECECDCASGIGGEKTDEFGEVCGNTVPIKKAIIVPDTCQGFYYEYTWCECCNCKQGEGGLICTPVAAETKFAMFSRSECGWIDMPVSNNECPQGCQSSSST